MTKSGEKGRGERRDALNLKERREPACKPGSVESSHSSGMRVAAHLERPTRELVWAHSALPYSVLLRVGFTVPQSVTTCAVRSYRTFSPLPHIAVRRYIFCGTFRRLAPPRRYLAPCPVEPGLSSEVCNLSDCPADSQCVVSHFAGRDWRSNCGEVRRECVSRGTPEDHPWGSAAHIPVRRRPRDTHSRHTSPQPPS